MSLCNWPRRLLTDSFSVLKSCVPGPLGPDAPEPHREKLNWEQHP
ncbi:hypothetical protein CGRA01v4_06381 [Colletotrichum graminicola]|nr:hypothetical protein CGRA01v4_06381 [Colletotrichum graminicola]